MSYDECLANDEARMTNGSDLERAYAAMAQDQAREAEALEWAEALVGGRRTRGTTGQAAIQRGFIASTWQFFTHDVTINE